MCFFKFVGELGFDNCIVSIVLAYEKFELWWVRQGVYFAVLVYQGNPECHCPSPKKKKESIVLFIIIVFFW